MTKCLIPLSEEQFQETIQEVGYNLETLQSDIKTLRNWAVDQKELPDHKIHEPDSFYELQIVSCKGSLELSKEKLLSYYYSRTKYPVLFDKTDPLDEDILGTADSLLIATLPKPTNAGSRVTMIYLTDTDHKKYDLLTGVLRLLLLIEMRGREEGVFNGEWIIFDACNITFGHVFKILVPRLVKSVLEYVQNVLNARIKGIIVINSPKFVEKTINTFIKPLLKKKIAERIFIYSEGREAICNHLPTNILPKEYGGEEESLKYLSDMWINKGKMEREWLTTVFTQKVDESKADKPKNLMKGSFFSGLNFFSGD